MFKKSALHFLVGAFLFLKKNTPFPQTQKPNPTTKKKSKRKAQTSNDTLTSSSSSSLAGSVFARLEQALLEEARVQLDQGDLGQTGAAFALVDRTVRNLRADDQQPPDVGFQLPAAGFRHRFRVGCEQLAPRERDGGDLYRGMEW